MGLSENPSACNQYDVLGSPNCAEMENLQLQFRCIMYKTSEGTIFDSMTELRTIYGYGPLAISSLRIVIQSLNMMQVNN